MDDKNKYGWKEVVHSFYFSQQNKKKFKNIKKKKNLAVITCNKIKIYINYYKI